MTCPGGALPQAGTAPELAYESMEFREVVARRRMVRCYTGDPVDRAALERIVNAGRRAPSAGFSQGQAFVVVTDRADRAAIAELAYGRFARGDVDSPEGLEPLYMRGSQVQRAEKARTASAANPSFPRRRESIKPARESGATQRS